MSSSCVISIAKADALPLILISFGKIKLWALNDFKQIVAIAFRILTMQPFRLHRIFLFLYIMEFIYFCILVDISAI